MAPLAPSLQRKLLEQSPELGFGTRVLNSALGGLGTLGRILDTPGSVARGLLAGEPGRAFSGIFNTSRRVSGTELLGGKGDEFSFGGLAAEILLDPVNFLTFGTTSAAGKLAIRASKLQNTAKAQRALIKFVPENTLVGENLRKSLASTEEALSKLTDTQPLANTFADQARQGQRALIGFRLPFQENQINLIQGAPVFEGASKIKSRIAQLPGVQPSTEALKKGFKRSTDNPVVEAFRQELRAADRIVQRQGLNREKELSDKLKVLRDEFGEEVDRQIRRVVEIQDIPEKLKLKDIAASDKKAGDFLKLRLKVQEELQNVPAPIKQFADELRKVNEEILESEIKSGVAVRESDDLIGFFSRRTTVKGAKFFESKRVQKFLNQQLEKLRQPTASFQRERLLKGLPTDELEQQLRARFPERLKKLGFKEGEKIFDDDIVRLQARREIQGKLAENRAILAQAVVDEFKSTKGVPVGEIIRPVTKVKGRNVKLGPLVVSTRLPLKGVRTREEFINDLKKPIEERVDHIDIPLDATPAQIKRQLKKQKVDEAFIEPEVFDDLTKLFKTFRDPLSDSEITGPFLKMMDTIHGFYRGALTGYFPSFHARNFVSGGFMNILARDILAQDYFNAVTNLRKLDEANHLRLASLGVLDEGKLKDILNIIQQPGQNVIRLPKGIEVDLVKLNQDAFAPARRVGQLVENINRYALFLAKKRKGFSDTEAAEIVRNFHFDYSDLTEFERAVPRRAILFYTFTRNNLPLMFEQYAKNPRFLQAYARATGVTNPNIVQPEWLPESFFFGNDEKNKSVRINFGLPPEDLARFDPDGRGLQRVLELLIANAVPAIREPFEFATGRSAFLGRPAEGSVAAQVAEATPFSRLLAQAQRLIEAPEKDRLPEEIFRQLTGINIKEIDRPRQRIANQADAVRDRLDELVRRGRARQIPVVGNRAGRSDEEVNRLNRILAKLQTQLREQ